MTDLADDVMVDALLMEVAGMLGRLIDRGEAGSIDLRGLPLSSACIATLEQRLGHGEIAVQLDAAGRSEIHETEFPGVWWARHADEAGQVIAIMIEVTTVPDILRADADDMARGLRLLPGRTHIATYASARRGS